MSRLTITLVVLLAMALPADILPSIHAAITYTGAVSPPPASWTSSNDAYIGIRAPGTVTVDSGSVVTSKNAYLGYYTGGIGTVTIDGVNSKWTNSSDLFVGYDYGSGTLNITGGGAVTVGAVTHVGSQYNGKGTISFDDGTLTTQSLYVSPTQLLGSGTINSRGLLTDTDIVFDSTHDLSQTVPGFGNITVNLNMSDPSNVGELGVGWMGSGSLTIRDGRAVTSKYGRIGFSTGSIGTASVDGDGSAWTSNNDLNIAESGAGALIITRGGAVTSVSGTVGRGSKSAGTVTVTGGGSKWSNNFLTIGNQGNGTLTIADGGTVSSKTAYLGVNSGSTGLVSVDGVGSNWTNSADLYLADHTNGTLKITNGGAVNDGTCYMGFHDAATASAIVDGPGSTWNHLYGLNVGYGANCRGTLSVTNGGALNTWYGAIGYNAGATGTVTISDPGSVWTNSTGNVYIGLYGKGTLNIVNGGAFINHEHNSGTLIASGSVATVDGSGSTWIEDDIVDVDKGMLNVTNGGAVRSDRLWLGYSGLATLRIAGGGTARDNTAYIGLQTGAKGMALVDGPGSSWNNTGELILGYVGSNRNGSATVDFRSGGAATASSVSINNLSLLTIDVGRGSSLSTGGGTITNNGTIRILAGADVPAGGTYAPVSTGTFNGTGAFQAVGGTWNADKHLFTASAIRIGTAGTPVAMDLAFMQRVLISDNATGSSLGASFPTKSSSTPFNLTAMTISDGTLNSLHNLLGPGESVLEGWNFITSGYMPGDPAYLSFDIGSECFVDSLKVWRYSGSTWTQFSPNDLTYYGIYASFTATDLSSYAVTGSAVPEPSILVLLSVGTIGLSIVMRHRRHQVI